MKFVTNIEPTIKYCNCYVIEVKGYFGDRDEPYHFVGAYNENDTHQVNTAMWQALLFYELCHNYDMETYHEMKKWLQEQYIPANIKVVIPTDSSSGEMLPNDIEKFDIHYYDDNGVMYTVNLEKD